MKRFTKNPVSRRSMSSCMLASMMLALMSIGALTVADYDLSWHTIDGGGGTSSGGGYALHGTIGQPDSGVMSGGGYELAGGFWAGDATGKPDCPIPADLNCDGVVNVSDLLILFDNWGTCSDCGNCPADLNGDCVVNVSDLLILFDSWG